MTDGTGSEASGISFEYIITAVAIHYRVVVGLVVFGALIAVATLVLRDDRYVASASFVPQQRIEEGEASLAASILGRGAGDGTASFFATLVESRRVLGELAFDTIRHDGDAVAAVQIYELQELARRGDLEGITQALQEYLTVEVDGNGIVSVELRAPDPEIAEGLLSRLIDRTQEFRIELRNSSARQDREFLEERLGDAEARLRKAEEDLSLFLDSNRRIANSPRLTIELERLRRVIDREEQRVRQLSAMYEEARFEEVRNTPVLTIVDRPDDSASLDRASMVRWLALGGGLGGIVGSGVSLLLRRWRMSEEEVARMLKNRVGKSASG